MATKITMPQLGESVTEGTIDKWLVKEGDEVKKYDPLCEVITDKVNAEVPSFVEGKITEIVAREGETVAVGDLICYIEATGEAAVSDETNEEREERRTEAKPAESPGADSMKRRFSPAVRKLAHEYHLDLSQIKGTGKGGRITRKDVLAVIESGGAKPAAEKRTDKASVQTPVEHAALKAEREDVRIPVSGVRRTIADRMLKSKLEIPHAWMMIEADVTNLVNYRNRVKEQFRKSEGFNLTYLPFFIKAVVEALKEYPMVNAVWDGDSIIQKKDVHISVAVATEEALYVPVIRNADQKSVYGLAQSVHQLAAKTREGTLGTEDVQGGTFTVNNTGTFGSVQSMPIINQPQAAILSVESIVKRPVVFDDMIAVRSMVNLCLSLDHRILDGLIAGRFLQAVKQRVENVDQSMALY